MCYRAMLVPVTYSHKMLHSIAVDVAGFWLRKVAVEVAGWWLTKDVGEVMGWCQSKAVDWMVFNQWVVDG
jgi:hypothetical protein